MDFEGVFSLTGMGTNALNKNIAKIINNIKGINLEASRIKQKIISIDYQVKETDRKLLINSTNTSINLIFPALNLLKDGDWFEIDDYSKNCNTYPINIDLNGNTVDGLTLIDSLSTANIKKVFVFFNGEFISYNLGGGSTVAPIIGINGLIDVLKQTQLDTIINFESTLTGGLLPLTNKLISSFVASNPFTVYPMPQPIMMEKWKFAYEISKTPDFSTFTQTVTFNLLETSKSISLDPTFLTGPIGGGYDAVGTYYFRGYFFIEDYPNKNIVKSLYTTNSQFSVFADF